MPNKKNIANKLSERLDGDQSIETSNRLLELSDDKFYEAFKTSPAIMGILSFDEAKFLEINDWFTEKLGFDKDHVIGKNLDELGLFVDMGEFIEMKEILSTDGRVFNHEVSLLSKDELLFIVAISAEKFQFESQECIFFIGTDVTEKKLAEAAYLESEERYRSVVESALDGIIIIQDRKVRFANKQLAQLLDYSHDELINSFVGRYIHKDYSDFITEQYMRLMTGADKSQRYETVVVTKDKVPVDVELHIGVTRINSRKAALVFVRDITERKLADQKIQRMNAELEKRVADRTVQLNMALDVLKQENEARKKTEEELRLAKEEISDALAKEMELGKMKSSFISMISHEYRTPLTVILSSSEIIKIFLEKDKKDKIIKHLDKINLAVSSMNELIEDVLSFTEMKSRKLYLNIVSFNLVHFLSDTIGQVRLIDHDGHEIVLESQKEDFKIETDKDLVHRVIMNLMTNSCKYSDNNTKITVSISDIGGYYQIDVADFGKGISNKDQKHLFQPFFKSSENIGIIGGTGLGLAIVKRCVDSLNGNINCVSKIGEGTIFSVYLPKKS